MMTTLPPAARKSTGKSNAADDCPKFKTYIGRPPHLQGTIIINEGRADGWVEYNGKFFAYTFDGKKYRAGILRSATLEGLVKLHSKVVK